MSDTGLMYLADLPYMNQLLVDKNLVTRNGLMDFITRIHRNKRDYFDGLVAQDTPDDSVIQPMYLSVEGNFVDQQMLVMNGLEQEEGIVPCCADTTGCDPGGVCSVFGNKCGIHLFGLGSQNSSYRDGE